MCVLCVGLPSVCLSLCMALASDFSKTIEIIIVKLGTVTASDMVMHHVLIILSWTFIHIYTDLNHEHNKCLIILVTIQAIPITFAVKIDRLKIYYDHCQSDDKCVSTWLLVNLQYVGQYLGYYIQKWRDGRRMDAIYAHARFDDLELDIDARSHWVGKGKNNQCWMLSATKQAVSI